MTTRPGGRPCTLVVCRGCCCGSTAKHPDTDHPGQLARLHEAAAASHGGLLVRTTDCLDTCAQSNVIVVQPSTRGRTQGGRPLWLGWALDDDSLDLITQYALAGGPGIAELPATLDLQRIAPPHATGPARTRR
ncbi:(2Fe-2S) ferredoxin domain-containing protein [Kitasatospora sp. RB6PN24]|uniref:(2Fe-2S) ferredoxin domain-containing protein n=1 Tax=Kitasatospora humi TaxID=2893891 RepID=UPI001E59C50B|nr:(2Fe-2S) ferredoxin domain-containing protein [Kitasatospora humi]MCC9311559.1 (2Fe-2S) ferredoxin domain-containing protein [Kitasatospora humi]